MPRTVIVWLLLFACLQTPAIGQNSNNDLATLTRVQVKILKLRRDGRSPTTIADELQITDAQLVEIAALRQEIANFTRENRRTRPDATTPMKEGQISFPRAAEEKLDSILTEEQRQRFEQLDLQSEGALTLLRPGIAPKIDLSAAQILRINDATRDHLFTGKGRAGPDSHATFGHTCFAILTEDQRSKWIEMMGKPTAAIQCRAPLLPGPASPASPKSSPHRSVALPPYSHLEMPFVEEQLRLSGDQRSQLAAARAVHEKLDSQQSEMTGTSLEKALFSKSVIEAQRSYFDLCDKVLSDEQKTRLDELQFQSLCEQALLDRVFREAAKLSDDQINSLDRLFTTRRPDESLSPTEKLAIRQETLQLGLKQITDSQRQIWDRLTGQLVPPEKLLK